MKIRLIKKRHNADNIDISLCFPIKDRTVVKADGRELFLFINSMTSIYHSLKKSKLNYEVVIADFKSTDSVLEDWVPDALGMMDFCIAEVDGDFSRGLGMNVCTANSRGKYLCFLDADMICQKEFFYKLETQYRKDNIFFPICFKADEANCHYSNYNFQDGEWQKHGYGLCSISRKRIDTIGNWPEFNSYGGEDNIFHENCKRLYSGSIRRHKAEGLLHQWHPPARNLNYKNKKTTDYFKYLDDNNKKKYYPGKLDKYKVI